MSNNHFSTHYQILICELDTHGQTTYATLMERYGPRGYTYRAFVKAVHDARRRGEVTGPAYHGGPIVRGAISRCPCCGQQMPA